MIRVGPAGWAYKDWEGIVYPPIKPKGFDPAGYLAQYFDTIEINSSFYGPPRPTTAQRWAERVKANSRFRFTAKLYQAFTHKRNATAQDEHDFKAGIEPLMKAERFGALLPQFPWSFRFNQENRLYLLNLQKRFREYPLVLEVRHISWAQPEVLDMLAEFDIGLANIDQPLFHKSIKPSVEVTAPTATSVFTGGTTGIGFLRGLMFGNATTIYTLWTNWSPGSNESRPLGIRPKILMLSRTTTISGKRW